MAVTTLPNTTAFPGQYNVYIPAFGGKDRASLIVSYARDPKKFAVNGLATRTPTQLENGNFLSLRPEALARVGQDPNYYIWQDGQPFPSGNYNAQDFRAVPYQCIRRGMPDYLGDLTKEQAVWPIESTKLDALAHIMMTLRAVVYYTLMLNPLNHLTTHVKTATQWSSLYGATGGGWLQGTPENPIIQRTMRNVANVIRQDTLAAVDYHNLTLVISVPAAINMASSSEINWYLAQSRFAVDQVRGDNDNQNGNWGLPKKLYGMNLIVDPTVKTTSPRLQVPGTFVDTMEYNTALFVAAPGSLGENTGQVNSGFSSTHMFVYREKEMVVKTKYMDYDEFTKYGIYEHYGLSIVAPETCGLATSLFV
jgi:hypothetical protein